MMRFIDTWMWGLDGWIIVVGMLCAVSAALLGNFVVLRRLSLLGDAITHAILPGLAIAFLVGESRSSLTMFVGAAIAGVLTTVLTESVRGLGRVDEGASMGVVFTSLFALGLVLIVQVADHVDLDPDCVLYGAIELTPLDLVRVGGFELPRAAVTLGVVTLVNLLFVVLFYKELTLSAFDPQLSTTTGFSARLMHYVLMILVAVTAVACFESVGNILVVAMLVVPPATSLLLTDRLWVMLPLSAVLGCLAAVLGHLMAIEVPGWFGFRSTTTAGMMAVAAGLLFGVATLASPGQGMVPRWYRQRRLAWSILTDDVVALLYRIEERGSVTRATPQTLGELLFAGRWSLAAALRGLVWQGEIVAREGTYGLTETGRRRGVDLVRSHRLWESYLVERLGAPAERIHTRAEALEHFTDPGLRERLDTETDSPRMDPHGREIPKATP
jgi:manganese/zinc/iron transport system permease protein